MTHAIKMPSPSMAVACVALGVSLGGTSYAAVKIPRDSVGRSAIREGAVGSAQIRDRSISAKDVRSGALGSGQIRDRSLNAADLRRGVIPAPPKDGTSVVRQQSGDPVASGMVGAVSAACKSGERATGGGGGFAGPPLTNDNVVDSIPVGDGVPMRWRISLFNGGMAARTPVAYVLCATG